MNKEIIIWLDMDGVLVDFDKGYLKLTNGIPYYEYYQEHGNEAAIKLYQQYGSKYWAELDWIDGGREVYITAKELFKTVNILSSSGTGTLGRNHELTLKGKYLWLKNNGLTPNDAVIVHDRHLKQRYASPNSVLIDDLEDNIREWNDSSGIGILHDSFHFHHTIDKLKEISLYKNHHRQPNNFKLHHNQF